MGYKWKPSASQRRAFAEKMQDPEEQAAYEQRRADKVAKRRENSQFDYATAGGMYVPSKAQYNYAMERHNNTTPEHDAACTQVCYGYSCQEKIHHDYIHIVNELIRKNA